MAELEARFENDRALGWRRPLTDDAVVLGRHPGEGGWSTEWDNFISRQHATLRWDNGRLHVARNPKAGNPVFFNNVPADDFFVTAGESFRIGNTVFTLHADPLEGTARPLELSIGPRELRHVRFEHADQRVEALAVLPEII